MEDYWQVYQHFIAAFEGLEKFLEIQKARQLLFEHDLCDQHECDINTEVQ
jgi:hypothetical protein